MAGHGHREQRFVFRRLDVNDTPTLSVYRTGRVSDACRECITTQPQKTLYLQFLSPCMKRRAFLSTALAATVLLSGCQQGTQPVALEARNFTDQPVSVDLHVFSADESVLYEHSDTLAAHQTYELTELDGAISHLELSVDDGETVRHEYNPTFEESCEGKLLYIGVHPNQPDFDYHCRS